MITAASVDTGAGGGDGVDKAGQRGEGGGFGLAAKPVGAYLIKDGQLLWKPAVDVNRLVTVGGVIVMTTLVLVARALTRPGRSTRQEPSSAPKQANQ